jgi:D-sedoheptulose 7-phosphate isomerase
MTDPKTYIDNYLGETAQIAQALDRDQILRMIEALGRLRANGGRLFILGIGGSAGNASHAVNDFRKIAGIESYTPLDNVSELTAWINDESVECVFANWLKTSRLSPKDTVMVFSVGGGTTTVSKNLVVAMEYAKKIGAGIVSIVSRDGGAALRLSDVCVRVPVVNPENVTSHAEGWQAVIWHLVVNALK